MSAPYSFHPVLDVRRTAGSVDHDLAVETAQQLRRRLILIDVLILVLVAYLHLGTALGWFAETGLGAVEWWYFGFVLTTLGPPLLLMSAWRSVSPRLLRILETIIFGSIACAIGARQWLAYHYGWHEGLAVPGREGRFFEIFAGDFLLPWIILIVFYGACIPSSGRRLVLAVSALVVSALVTMGLIAWSDTEEPPYLGEFMFRSALPKMFIWLSLAALIAIYGGERLRALRREALLAARELGQYILKRRLGSGGMGDVFLAEHRLLRRPCAVKLIRPERAGDVRSLERFRREVSAMAKLTHPNTVQVFDYGFTDDHVFYYVMEYLRGLTLQELVDRFGPLSPERAVDLLLQTCAALQEAHAHGLLHRDIKPSNVFVGERGLIFDTVKLLDFGLVQFAGSEGTWNGPGETPTDAAWSHELTATGALLGTPLYLSPEQAAGTPLDARSDIYSLGLVAYFILSGQVPFRRDTVARTVEARLQDPVPSLLGTCSRVDVDLAEVVMRCLARDPANRFPGVAQLSTALTGCSCAGRWTAADAAEWWRRHAPELAREEAAPAESSPLTISSQPADLPGVQKK